MNRRRADVVVGLIVGLVLVGGGALSWQAYRQRRAIDESMGPMMDTSMGSMHAPDPVWYVFGTLLVGGAIVGVYLLLREEIPEADETDRSTGQEPDVTTDDGAELLGEEGDPKEGVRPETDPETRVLDLLPDDERRVLEPVIESPGITQIELRDRSEFSKSKVSQTVSALEKRGLLYRERQGRTYRVYPSEELSRQADA